jgi:hypothetical protein
MTEARWLVCEDAARMLEFVRGLASDRKLRLFASALCGGVDLAERHADAEATDAEVFPASLDAVRGLGILQARYFWQLAMTDTCHPKIRRQVAEILRLVELGDWNWYWHESGSVSFEHDNEEGAKSYNVRLLRCIFGNPFRPVTLDPGWTAWNGGTVPKLARAVYQNRTPPGSHVPARLAFRANDAVCLHLWGQPPGVFDPQCVAVLADALEEAGCAHADILNHCRQPGVHVRGCWALDLILGKE